MRTSITIIALAIFCLPGRLKAQQVARWEFGIQAEHGRDWYHRNYYNRESLPSGLVKDFPSFYSRGAGLFAERFFNPRFSAVAQLTYAQKKMPVEMFGEPSGTLPYYKKEIHHRGVVDMGVRWYINPKSRFRFFIDGKAGINMFVSAVRHSSSSKNVVTSDAFGYDRISPVVSGSVGIKWSQLAISAEYKQDLAPVKRQYSATGIISRGLVGKVAFTLVRMKMH